VVVVAAAVAAVVVVAVAAAVVVVAEVVVVEVVAVEDAADETFHRIQTRFCCYENFNDRSTGGYVGSDVADSRDGRAGIE
jgi:hypothetical protein